MMSFLKIISFVFLSLLIALPIAYADDEVNAEEEVVEKRVMNTPLITFSQRVDSVITMQKSPAVLKATVEQVDDELITTLVIRNSQDRKQAKALATTFIRLIKQKSLDDNPAKKKIGKGLYTYKIEVARANKTVLATGIKRADETVIEWAINDAGETNEAMLEDELPQ